MAKKNFKIQQTNIIPVKFDKPSNNDLCFETTKGNVDFKRWLYVGRPKANYFTRSQWADREHLVNDLFNGITQLSFEMSPSSIQVLAADGCRVLFEFLDERNSTKEPVDSIEQFNRNLIDELLIWLRNKPAKTDTGKLSVLGARRHYTSIKSILMFFTRQGRISKDIFPYAPFVNVNRSGKGTLSNLSIANALVALYGCGSGAREDDAIPLDIFTLECRYKLKEITDKRPDLIKDDDLIRTHMAHHVEDQ